MAHIEGAVNRVPVLENTGIKSTVCGPESFTPDHKPVMGMLNLRQTYRPQTCDGYVEFEIKVIKLKNM